MQIYSEGLDLQIKIAIFKIRLSDSTNENGSVLELSLLRLK
jgi:hypothetical protein